MRPGPDFPHKAFYGICRRNNEGVSSAAKNATKKSRRRIGAFSVPGVQWVYTAARCKAEGASAVTRNMSLTLEKLKPHITQGNLYTAEDWKDIPLWGTSWGSRDDESRKADSQAKRLQWEDGSGYMVLGDLTEAEGMNLAKWEQRRIKGAERMYQCHNSSIRPCKSTEETEKSRLYNPVEVISFKVGQGRSTRVKVENLSEGAELMACRWVNDSTFFAAANGQIRRMLMHNKELIQEKDWTMGGNG
ncbi:hypothetical protein R1sor_004919 [Riccia sorocarpa]|uniref:Uncharacterized protein n=1 Tax=Riccia sorocarpa TaxID=122646 RepID=A0ABD3HIL3_9MARC